VNIYNISSDDDVQVTEIVKIVTDEMGLNPKINFTGGEQGWIGDIPHMLLDSARLRAIGWKPEFNSKQAVIGTTKELLREPNEP